MVIKAKNWKETEDTRLVRTWMAIAQDPVTGNEQRAEHLWDHVQAELSAHLPRSFDDVRKNDACKNRWQILQKASSVSNNAELSEKNSSHPIGRRGAKYQARQAEFDMSIAKSLSSAAKSSAKLAVIAEKKIVALEKLAESQRLAANNQIMCTNVEVLDEVAREYFMLQKRRILRDLRQQEQEIELAHAVTMAMDPEIISLADEDADAPSVTLEEELEVV
uniref:AlNc14C166G7885 protein n=1 Tax=Albugo laibachii Nc14 TaxID=890382 RepID=F0WN52_9STRA|nr:AlNc14C166G7885 [Albugo laibachii Nc14]|eukprot:CCA22741.1 AlNc14C166G7885 [Albugo laibachii Nc14]